jgi:hypothetical protein
MQRPTIQTKEKIKRTNQHTYKPKRTGFQNTETESFIKITPDKIEKWLSEKA